MTELEPVEQVEEEKAEAAKPRSRARLVIYGLVAAFVVMLCFLAFAVARLVNTVNDGAAAVAEPIGDRVRQLFVPATPVILPDPVTVVRQINDLSRLETASYEMEKIVTADSTPDGLLGALLGEQLIFVAYGKVYAGVDFSQMTAQDLVVVDPDTVMVHLPPAAIFEDIPALDNERSYVADRDKGLLTSADPALETQVRQAAEASIREAAAGSDILDRANANAQGYMRNFLGGLGFTDIVFTDQTPPPAAPYQQQVPKGYYLLPTPSVTPAAP
ncbi:DUF4230 domain-containing protein [Promineifilum sp.]|uniref:DUF4230 domain-containing protein n=1 Tax=Promineifilum sp. TaxID=2664178 RepID=UPI0035B046D2